jgi:hypothetical protein
MGSHEHKVTFEGRASDAGRAAEIAAEPVVADALSLLEERLPTYLDDYDLELRLLSDPDSDSPDFLHVAVMTDDPEAEAHFHEFVGAHVGALAPAKDRMIVQVEAEVPPLLREITAKRRDAEAEAASAAVPWVLLGLLLGIAIPSALFLRSLTLITHALSLHLTGLASWAVSALFVITSLWARHEERPADSPMRLISAFTYLMVFGGLAIFLLHLLPIWVWVVLLVALLLALFAYVARDLKPDPA